MGSKLWTSKEIDAMKDILFAGLVCGVWVMILMGLYTAFMSQI